MHCGTHSSGDLTVVDGSRSALAGTLPVIAGDFRTSGDLIFAGAVQIEGDAWVRGAAAGSGLLRITEEVRLGIADALRSLGDHRAERTALQEFLRAHPDSLMGTRVRQRVRSLLDP